MPAFRHGAARSGTERWDDARRLQTTFRLKRSEAPLAAALAGGASLAAFAGQRGVAVSTARIQLKALCEKTGTGRQGELVRGCGKASICRWLEA